MKPVIIFRHACCENAGYLGTFLEHQNIPWRELRLDLDAPMPADVSDFSGVVLMGGPMSVNDDIPWIDAVVQFIQQAFLQDIPVLGHCLGGQLMSKALGATVVANTVKEVGWGKVAISENQVAKQWFGDAPQFLSFHWHNETFGMPEGATHLLSSAHCENQAYAIGKHLAMQCHIEMTEPMVEEWCDIWLSKAREIVPNHAVQTHGEIYDEIGLKLHALNAQAHFTYSHWIKGLIV